MVWTHNQMVEQKSNKKVFISIIAAVAATLTLGVGVYAHGGVQANPIDSSDSNCMGQLARLHAQDDQYDRGVKGSLEARHHSGFIGDTNNDEKVGEEMRAFQRYCKADQ